MLANPTTYPPVGKKAGKLGTRRHPRPLPKCQCTDKHTGKGCQNIASEKSLFCDIHKDCPKPPLSGYEPCFSPDIFNNDIAARLSHNCYDFFKNPNNPIRQSARRCKKQKLKGCRALFSQPGDVHGDRNALNTIERRACPVLDKFVMKDNPGITKTTFYEKCPAGTSKGALVSDKYVDYHFLIQHKHKDPARTGYWSHKPGSNKVTEYDALGRLIYDPRHAVFDYTWQGDDLNYDELCAFYCVPRGHGVVLKQGEASSLLQKKQKKQKQANEIRRVLTERRKLSATQRKTRGRRTRKHRRESATMYS